LKESRSRNGAVIIAPAIEYMNIVKIENRTNSTGETRTRKNVIYHASPDKNDCITGIRVVYE
jgi:hypothetical protein